MSFKSKGFKFLGMVAIVALMAGIAWAATDTYDTPVGAPGTTDHLPRCVYATGTSSATTEDITITIPDGFTPNRVNFWANYTTSAGSIHGYWVRSMPSDSVFSITAAGDPSYVTSGGVQISTTNNTVLLSSEMQMGSGAYIVEICR